MVVVVRGEGQYGAGDRGLAGRGMAAAAALSRYGLDELRARGTPLPMAEGG